MAIDPQGTRRSSDASGSLADFSAPVGAVTVAIACSPEVHGYLLNLNGAGAFSTPFPIGWQGPVQATASFYALQYTPDGTGLPASYGGLWGLGGVTLTDGGTATGLSLPRGLASEQPVTATVSGLPNGYTLTWALPAVALSPDCGMHLPYLTDPSSTFGYVAPSIDGATFQVAVEARNGAQDAVYAVAALGSGESEAGVDYAWTLSTTPFATADEAATRESLRLLAGMRSLNAPLPVTAWAETNARHNVAAP